MASGDDYSGKWLSEAEKDGKYKCPFSGILKDNWGREVKDSSGNTLGTHCGSTLSSSKPSDNRK